MMPECGDNMLEPATHGSIQSPGYPADYPHNRDCVWTLRTTPGRENHKKEPNFAITVTMFATF